MGTIKIIIDEEGQIKVEAKEGFEGKSCQEAIDFIMNNLPTGFAFEELETIRHGNYSVVAENEPQAYLQTED
ncbi:MAG: hypothetical protein CMA57_05025 [Euryarchaeota archaeon]|jgi:hypothetical protein|nr:hypothetical protein [Euryarchaeota archaeon]|tara:strand:+ start:248 stop:463 length:216 start_codon:yes stop_codon:yes gene_type:complete